MNISEKRTNTIIESLVEKHNLEYCYQYGEPGYTDPEKGILFCDWNPVSRTIQDYLEEVGFELEWSDEWHIDYENDKAWRTSPDCYSWVCQICFCDGFVLTPDDDISEWIEEHAMSDKCHPTKALPDWISTEQLAEEGYALQDGTFESGWHHGQDDDPQEIATQLLARGYESVVFQIDSSEQFCIEFKVYTMGELEASAA